MGIRDIFLTLIVVLLWGGNFPLIKYALTEMSPSSYGALRFVVSLLPIFFLKKPDVKWCYLLGVGVFLNLIKFALLFIAIDVGLSAGLASLLLQMQAFFTIIFSSLYLGQRPTRMQIFGTMIAFLGMGWIGLNMQNAHGNLTGLILIFGAAISWGIANLFYKQANCKNMVAFNAWASLIAPIPFIILSTYLDGPFVFFENLPNITLKGWGCILYAGIASTIVAASIWGHLIQKHSAALITPFALLIPIVGMGTCCMCHNELMTVEISIGCLTIFLGLIINQITFKEKN
jgi:O-acetylserine/cysteine efflux transporter